MIKIKLLANDFMKGETWESEYHRELSISNSALTFTGERHKVHLGLANPSHEEVIDDLFFSPETAIMIASCLLKQAELCKRRNLVNQLELFTQDDP